MDVLGEWVPLAGKKCDCSKSGLKCFYDETCPGLGCGAEGKTNCRFCGSGEFADCPAPQTSEPKEDKAPHEAPPKKEKKEKANKPSTDTPSLILGDHKTKLPHAGHSSHSMKCPCESSQTQRCFYDPSCPGLGCGALGHVHCRFCGGHFNECPSAHELAILAALATSKPPANADTHPPPAAAVATQPQSIALKESPTLLDKPMSFDVYRCMAAAAVDTHPMEDDDIADLAGAIKYVHTEILTEHLQSPIRTSRKYHVDAITAHRFRIKNPSTILHRSDALQGEFGAFVTYDWGKATNPAQLPMIADKGNFVGIAPCTNLHCDVRFPRHMPYSWLSLGNWCPNLTWDKKGSKKEPNPSCLKSTADKTIIKGGLCPNGFTAQSTNPGSDPSGEQECVYTYGKAKVVKWDDIVGITREDCGKRKCKDWLDFRMNCTNSQYKRQFTLDGKTKTVDYCIEFDIHPACEANCEVDKCKDFLASGKETYLGLAFWHGRCDPRANERRIEMVAYALGIPGALKSHELVDTETLERPCPLSKGTSWTCQPVDGHGPYCTRSYNGACDQCFIPGVVNGVSLKPWCPLDILSTPTYTDMPKPHCKSRAASDGCCLYTNTCEGTSDPSTAALTDDGLALVASRRSTLDMEQFLRRAASKEHRFSSLDVASVNLKWAAYFAWSTAPTDRKLAQALDELEMFLSSKTAVITQYATTTTTTLPKVHVGPAKVPSSLECAEREVSFMPLDMPDVPMTLSTLAECQKKCSEQKGCFHFSFLAATGLKQGSCHLAGFSALAEVYSPSWISGPPKCWNDLEEKSLMIDKGHNTYVPVDFACMSWGSSFPPTDGPLISLPPQDFPKEEDAVLECQKRCRKKKNCEHFTVSFPLRTCALAGPGAMVVDGIAGAISGPPKCDEKAMQSYYWEVLPNEAQLPWRWAPPLSAMMISGVLLAAGVAFFVFRRRQPQRTVRGVQRALVPEDDRLESWWQESEDVEMTALE
ncbi:unnamed protein product [Symbiodinium natans]|uniref:Apple domain-containing protein n=1 Tax=Symbiodinium natans TaxID=878477 RepID=A0A812UIH4_9DINO|nr:unnamed protein product [Symbiodinium natans]